MTGLLEEVMPERRKEAYGMTGLPEEVMLEKRKEAYGMTGLPEKVMPERRKWVCGMTVAGKGHAGEKKRGVWHDSCRLATPETGKKARVPGCGAARKRIQPPRKQ